MEAGFVAVTLKLLAVMVLVLANGFFVACEFSLVAVRRSRVDELVAEKRTGALRLKRAVTQLDAYLAATQLGITMSSLGLGWLGEPTIAALLTPLLAALPGPLSVVAAHSIAVVIAFTIITMLHIVLGELMPKSIALQRSERTALFVTGPLRLYLVAFLPAIALLNGTGNLLLRAIGLQPGSDEENLHSAEELRLLVTASYGAGMLHPTQREVVDRVFTLQKQRIANHLTPRSDIEWLDLEDNSERWRETARTTEYAWLPVGRSTVNTLVGSVRAKDVIGSAVLDASILARMASRRPMLVLVESMLVLSAFEQLRRAGTGVAIVVDEYGEVLGLVTLADLMTAFIGDVPDASGTGQADPVGRADDTWTLDAMLPVDEVKRLLDIQELPPRAGSRYHTLAGLFMELLVAVPCQGDTVTWENKCYTVTRMRGRRVEEILVRVMEAAPGPAGDGEAAQGSGLAHPVRPGQRVPVPSKQDAPAATVQQPEEPGCTGDAPAAKLVKVPQATPSSMFLPLPRRALGRSPHWFE